MKLQKYRSHSRDGNNKTNKLTNILFLVYLIVLVWILLFKLGVRFSYMGDRRINLIPFRDVLISNGKIDVAEIILNIVIFIPLGIYAGVLFEKRTFRNKLFFSFIISLLFEAFQFIFRVGAFDITDIINNTFGGIIGLMLFEVIKRIFNNSVKAQKFINIIAATGTLLMVALLILLKLNMLPVRYQ